MMLSQKMNYKPGSASSAHAFWHQGYSFRASGQNDGNGMHLFFVLFFAFYVEQKANFRFRIQCCFWVCVISLGEDEVRMQVWDLGFEIFHKSCPFCLMEKNSSDNFAQFHSVDFF